MARVNKVQRAVERRAAALANPSPTVFFVKACGPMARTAPTWGEFKHRLVDCGVIPYFDSDVPREHQEAYKRACGR